MLYVLSTSLYKSYQVDKFIKTVEDENKSLEQTNADLIEDYEYYKSDSYKEKNSKAEFWFGSSGRKSDYYNSGKRNLCGGVAR